ncbi:unnamed protein product, partial [Prorocentrum cordatum]
LPCDPLWPTSPAARLPRRGLRTPPPRGPPGHARRDAARAHAAVCHGRALPHHPFSAALHLTWAVLLLCRRRFRQGAGSFSYLELESVDANAACCLAVVLSDAAIFAVSSRGTVMEVERRRAVPWLLVLRLWFKCWLFLTVILPIPWLCGGDLPLIADSTCRCVIVTEVVCHTLFLVLAPTSLFFGSGEVLGRIMACVQRLFGGKSFRSDLNKLLMQVHDEVDLVPSDIAFGLWLVGRRQRLMRKNGPPAGVPVNLDEDKDLIRDILTVMPIAFNVYGWVLYFCQALVRDIVSCNFCELCRMIVDICRACPCRGCFEWWCVKEHTKRKWPLHTWAFKEELRQAGLLDHVDILHASWNETDDEQTEFHAVPMAVLVCRPINAVVITVRGTFSGKDLVADLDAHLEDVEPHAPDREKCHGAHAGMLRIVRYVKKEWDLVKTRLAGDACCSRHIICTGHSMGAGVAALLALELRKDLGDCVRYIGFEPPGATMSPDLADKVKEMGGVSIIHAHDWAPRISIRSIQYLRERIVLELAACNTSKLGMAIGMCMCRSHCENDGIDKTPTQRSDSTACRLRPQNTLSEMLLAHLSSEDVQTAADHHPLHKFSSRIATKHERDDYWADPTRCPGKLMLVRPTQRSTGWPTCGIWKPPISWDAMWIEPEEIEEIVVTKRALMYHVPALIAQAVKGALGSPGKSADTAAPTGRTASAS